MPPAPCRWVLQTCDSHLVAELARQTAIHPVVAQCLVNRGFRDAAAIENFLEPRLSHLSDPFLLPDMDRAVERLARARQLGEEIVIFGDYDVDGVTSTALLIEFLRFFDWKVSSYLPHRLEEGYGLSRDAVERLLQKTSPDILLAVDCGSTSADIVADLEQRGLDVIILDHHQIPSRAPAATALVNPQRLDGDPAGLKNFCSAGLAFKLAHALLKRAREQSWPRALDYDLRETLDFVALGTIADLVPLQGENRILAAKGLERINQRRRPGLIALLEVSKIEGKVGVYETSFQLAPRLNAAGRLETAQVALELLLARDVKTALPLAAQLDSANRSRQQIEAGIVEEVTAALRSQFDPARDLAIVEGREPWHVGVVGIVASRVLREFYRPTIIFGGDGNSLRGSGRSIEGFDLASALRECGDLLLKHGGHSMAAGVSIEPGKLPLFREKLNQIVRARLAPEQLIPCFKLDCALSANEVKFDVIQQLQRLEPLGIGNAPVRFLVQSARIASQPQRMGPKQRHAKFLITAGGPPLQVLWWNRGDLALPEGVFDLACEPQLEWDRGSYRLALKALDWRPSEFRDSAPTK